MINRFDEAIGRFAAACVAASHRRARLVVAVAALVTVGSLHYTATQLGVNADTMAMMSEKLPFRQLTRELQEAFPQLEAPLIVVIDARTPDLARQSAERLADRLAEQPATFHSVFVPGMGPFFERNGILYHNVADLEEFARRVEMALPFLAELARTPTLAAMITAIERSVTSPAPPGQPVLDLPELIDGMAEAINVSLDEGARFSWQRWALGTDLEPQDTRRIIVVQPVLDYSELEPARRSMNALRSAAAELGLAGDSGVRVRVTGDPALSAEEMELVERQAGVTAVIASFALVALLLTLGLRSARLVFVILTTLAAGLAWTAGFATLAVGHLNLVSVAFAVLFIGLGVDFGIHFGLRYRELRSTSLDTASALAASGRTVGSSLVLCAITTAIGFYAFVPTDYAGVAELGVISGTGVFLSLIATLGLLPALITVTDAGAGAAGAKAVSKLNVPLLDIPLRHPRVVCLGALAVGAVAASMLPQVRFDPDPLNVRDPSAESVQAMRDLLADGNATAKSPWTVQVVADDVDHARELASRLEDLDVVSQAVTVADFVPEDQDAKLVILGRAAAFLASLNAAAREPGLPAPEHIGTATALARFAEALETRIAAEAADDERLQTSLRRLSEAASRAFARIESAERPTDEIDHLENAIFADLPRLLEQIEVTLALDRVSLADIPTQVQARFVAGDGRARIEVFPRRDLNEQGALEEFVDSIRTVTPSVAGPAVEIVESGRTIVTALRQALGTALVAIAVVLVLLWRSFKDSFLVVSALLLAALLTAATSVITELHFNFADVIVLPLLLGIGVDSGIHLVHRHRTSGLDTENLLHTSTARAVMFSALTTICSFGSLAVSTHLGIASLGKLLTIGISLTLVANLVFLPALVTWVDRPRSQS